MPLFVKISAADMRMLRTLAFCMLAIALCTQSHRSLAQSAATATAVSLPSSAAPDAKESEPASDPIAGLLSEANFLLRKGDYEGALVSYQNLLAKNPQSPDAYAGLARVYLKMKDVGKASETVTKGLHEVDAWPLHVALGEVEFRQGKIPEAEKEWVGVINAGHTDARALFGMARVRWAISMNKSAKYFLEKAHQFDPDDPEIQQAWAGTLSRSERIKELEKFLADPGGDPEEHVHAQLELDELKSLVAEASSNCRLVSKRTSTQTPMVRMLIDPIHIRGYGLTVEVNGQKTRLLLDTGSSGILINRRAAEKAGVTRLTDVHIGGIGDNGSESGYAGLAHSIKIGDLEFQDCPVDVWDKRSVVGEEGLIGADVFQDFLVELDFPKEKLRLNELPKRPQEAGGSKTRTIKLASSGNEEEPGDADAATPNDARKPDASAEPQDRYVSSDMRSYTQIYRFGHNLLVPTKIGDIPNKLFLLDTGALSNQITPAAAREVTKVRGDSDTIVKGLSGSVKKVYSADKAILQFGHLRQENQDLLAFDLTSISDNTGTEVSGTLGFVLLHLLDIKIDYRDGLIDFNYKP